MDIFRRIFFVVVLSGTMAGLLNAAIQQWRVVPLILEAELYEGEEHSHDAPVRQALDTHDEQNQTVMATHAHDLEQAANDGHAHSDTKSSASAREETEPWAPQDGVERTSFTILATLLTGVGFAFLLAALSIFTKIEITVQNGLLWGLGGYLAFALMPAIGLSPELPGMVAAELGARQIWWWVTALATLSAILVVVKLPNYMGIAIALVLIALPHLMGAPVAPHDISKVPAHLASSFAANALFASLAFWLTLGVLFGHFNQLLNKES